MKLTYLWPAALLATGVLAASERTIPKGMPSWYMADHPTIDEENLELTCESDWPSESGNHNDGGVKNGRRAVRLNPYVPDRAAAGFDTLFNENNTVTADTLESFINSTAPGSLTTRDITIKFPYGEGDCCRPTYECYHLLKDIAKEMATDEDGVAYIKEESVWKQVACCIYDYWGSCKYPKLDIAYANWREPPQCSD